MECFKDTFTGGALGRKKTLEFQMLNTINLLAVSAYP